MGPRQTKLKNPPPTHRPGRGRIDAFVVHRTPYGVRSTLTVPASTPTPSRRPLSRSEPCRTWLEPAPVPSTPAIASALERTTISINMDPKVYAPFGQDKICPNFRVPVGLDRGFYSATSMTTAH